MSGIHVENNLGPLSELLRGYECVYVVYDRRVEGFAAPLLEKYPSLPFDTSEERKTLSGVGEICSWLLEQGADRQALVLSVGGGIMSDMAGFAASIFKRGVRYANVPTTLLAMVDAGIGGKTGVNFHGLKNMLGVIRQSEFTYISTDALGTLSQRDFRSGVAELLKTFIISDSRRYRMAVEAVSRGDRTPVPDLIRAAAGVKSAVVKKDPEERGLRRILNLGHTYAHAVEWYQQTHPVERTYSHGEAVAIGIVKAAELSERRGCAQEPLSAALRRDFAACGLPVDLPFAAEELAGALRQDKKAEERGVNFVFIRRIGEVVVEKVPFEEII